jgi:hypothetical protein
MKLETFAIIIIVLYSVLFSSSFISAQEKVENFFFSLDIPEDWIYKENSNLRIDLFGGGSNNVIISVPREYGILLDGMVDDPITSKRLGSAGAISIIGQDTNYSIKNNALSIYTQYFKLQHPSLNISSQQVTMVDNQKAYRVDGDYDSGNIRFVTYLYY